MKHLLASGLLGVVSCVMALSAHAVPVNFPDANLEAAVRAAFDDLGTPLGAQIDSEDLVGAGFIELEAIGENISDLSGLEFATDLEFLDLSQNAITSVAPLASLTNLVYLDLGTGDLTDGAEPVDQDNNFITDISPLSGLTNLEYLNLGGNRSLTDISPLSGLAGNLQLLALAYSPISDFSVLAQMTNLIRLLIVDCGMTDADLSNLSGLTSLLTLYINSNEITDISSLAGLTGLLDLLASNNQITDISMVEFLADPEFLFFDDNQITDLAPMVNNPNIGGDDIVNVGGNPLSNEAACDQIPVIEARFTTGIFAYDATCFDVYTLTVNITGTGDTNLGSGDFEFLDGEVVNLVAVPVAGSGFAFDRFQGAVNTTSMFVNIAMTEDRTVEVVFVTPGVHSLTINKAGAGDGFLSPPAGVYTYLDGRTAVLTAIPDANSDFGGWSGDVSSASGFAGVLMNGDKDVTATFVEAGNTFTLTMGQTGEGSIDPSAGSYVLAEGTPINLTAIPAPGWVFDGWTGDIGGADASNQIINVTLTQDRNITANFVPDGLDHTLFISVQGQGQTTPSGPFARYLDQDVAELIARTIPNSGFAFDRWEGDIDSTSAFDEILMDDDKNVTAVFVSPGDHELTIINNGGSGLSVFPPAGVHAFMDGRIATIAVFPQPGEFFGGFSGDVTSVAPVVNLEMDDDKTVTVNFGDSGFNLEINTQGQGTTTPEAGRTYALATGTEATLFATPTVTGWVFDQWIGDIGAAEPTDEVITVTIDQDRSVTAVFVEDEFDWSLDINVIGTGSTDPEPGISRWMNNDVVNMNPVGIPGSGFAFLRWEGAVNSTEEFVTVTMTSDREVDAIFVEGDHTVTINIAGDGEGTTFPLPGVQSYVDGRFATLTAFPEPGSFFAGWTGDITELNPVINFFMNEDKVVTANFTTTGVTLNLAIQGQGSTTPSPGSYALATGQTVNLTALDTETGWRFDRWEGDIGGADPTNRFLSVFMGTDRDITAVFEEVTFDAILNLSVTGPGSITPAPGQYGFFGLSNTQFVTATPNQGAIFLGWQGDIGANNPLATGIDLLMDQNRDVTAVFAEPDFELTIARVGDGQILPVPGTYGYASGAEVELTATDVALSGFLFDRWEGDIGDNDPESRTITVTMDQDRLITGIFVEETRLTLSIEGTGETDPEAGVYFFKSNEQVELTALPIGGSGFGFFEWQGDIGDADASAISIVLDMDEDRVITAVFAQTYSLTIAVANDGTTDPEPGTYSYFDGQEATVTAVNIPGSGFIFDRWEGNLGGADPLSNPINLVMSANRSIIAVFAEGVPEGEGEGDGEGGDEGEGEGDGEFVLFSHSADQNGDGLMSLSELLRVIQFFNLGGYFCQPGTEDGYAPGPSGDDSCTPHSSDYNPQNWRISLSELLRLVQFFNLGGYYACPDQNTEDGFCPGPPPAELL